MSPKSREDIIAAVRAAQERSKEEEKSVIFDTDEIKNTVLQVMEEERETEENQDIKPEPKPVQEAKPESKPGAKPVPRPTAKAAPKAEEKSAPKPAAKPAPKPVPKPAAKAAPKTKEQATPKPAAKLAPKPTPKAEEKPAPKPQSMIDKKVKMIEVNGVSMVFKVSSGNANGLKDFFIQKIKGKMKKHELRALDNINFDVYKGEVVGIIGTNGSGKSTLLKIVSGVLNPTEGKVNVDRNKVQLLTLGTGFDFELTGKENVYLNGALIGYTKDFINEHYEDIVDFAEIRDFMGEKVKNYSSGMVSRLAFAIATAGNAAEILILDEVLSVGDAFFREKSLKRVKEMIQGGSTVLIVSHNINTIKQYCDRVVWIEKGVQMMVGTSKEVCDAYAKLQKK